METILWLVVTLLAGLTGYLLARALARRWPQHRVALMIGTTIAFLAWILLLDIEPPWEASTLRTSRQVLPPSLEIVAWLIHYAFFGAVFGAGGTPPVPKSAADKSPT